MISVPNHLQLLNGNKLFLLFILFLVSCSPKVRTVKTVPPDKNATAEVKPVEKIKKFKQVNFALLLPFHLKRNNDAASKADVDRAEMAIDFYQGFKMGVDSAAVEGQDFKITVIDTKGATEKINDVLDPKELTDVQLVVGPVFPEGLKQIGKTTSNAYFISPLAATMPEEFQNPEMIFLIPNIRLHAEKIKNYIFKKYDLANLIVVLINPKNPESEILGAQYRSLFNTVSKKYIFQEYSSVGGLETRLQKNKQYVVLVSSPDKDFVVNTLDKLAKIKSRLHYPIDVYGHPYWSGQTYNVDQLQALNVIISTSYHVNYKRPVVISFVRKYRQAYNFEPSEYAFKGYDTGFYFAKLLAKHGADFMQHITNEHYNGLQNAYSFYKDDQLGYINAGIALLRYKNYTLTPVD